MPDDATTSRRAQAAAQRARLRRKANGLPDGAVLTTSEIATIMGWAPSTVRSTLRPDRLGVQPLNYRSPNGQNCWPGRDTLLALANRPGQGVRGRTGTTTD